MLVINELRRRVQPLTWAALAALMPLLGWDVWQTVQDVKHRHEASQARPLIAERLPANGFAPPSGSD